MSWHGSTVSGTAVGGNLSDAHPGVASDSNSGLWTASHLAKGSAPDWGQGFTATPSWGTTSDW
jgi:hypothetical protein